MKDLCNNGVSKTYVVILINQGFSHSQLWSLPDAFNLHLNCKNLLFKRRCEAINILIHYELVALSIHAGNQYFVYLVYTLCVKH